MPSRFRVALIVVFWLATMSWLVVREVLPRYRAGEPPGFTIELTDEVGTDSLSANRVDWLFLFQGSKIGTCFSEVRRNPDRTFDQKTHIKFDDISILDFFKPIKLQINYVVTQEGHLVRMSVFGAAKPEFEGDIKGVVEDGFLKITAVFRAYGQEVLKPDIAPVKVAETGNIVSPMHLQNRISGLWIGRTWSVPMMNSFSALVPSHSIKVPQLHATVFGDTMEWRGEPVDCFRIDQAEPGKEAAARTWVRQRDGLLLKQEANFQGMELVLLRIPAKS
jgi:hypothetical protein